MKTKHYLFGLLFLFAACLSFGNAAQPGIWSSGGMSQFNLIYSEDSLAFRKIQMVEEDVFIQLYAGYAVTKGVYRLKNTTDEVVSLRTGYPVHGAFQEGRGGKYVNGIQYDDLYEFQVDVNGKQPELRKDSIDYDQNWLVWPMEFAPQETQTVTVYFLVNTNVGEQSHGYKRNHRNAYIYLIESGSTWKQPIIQGDFYVDLQLSKKAKYPRLENIFATLPGKAYQMGEHSFHLPMQNFSPTPESNIVITYGKKDENFNFSNVTSQANELYKKIDSFSAQALENTTKGELLTFKSAYEVTGISFWEVLFIIPFLLIKYWWVWLLLIIGFIFWRKRKRS